MNISGHMENLSFIGGLPRFWKRVLLITSDVVLLIFALWFSYALRLGFSDVEVTRERVLLFLLAPLVAIPVFIRLGLYRAVVRYLPSAALWTIVRAMAMATLLWVIFVFLMEMSGQGIVPRSVPLLYFVFGTLLMAGSRFAVKFILTGKQVLRQSVMPVLIYGTGESALYMARSLNGYGNRDVVGLIDENSTYHNRDMEGFRVYSPDNLSYLVSHYGIKEIVLSLSSIPAGERQRILEKVAGLGVELRNLPDVADIVDGRYLVNQIREIDIDDLLGRSVIPADGGLLSSVLAGRVVMVTGAGGSIGSELCRLIVKWKPALLILFESNEFALYKIERELRNMNGCTIIPVLGSITNDAVVRRSMIRHHVEVVYHAAAYKHVPLVEHNVIEGIRNNIYGTLTVAQAAFDLGVERFVLISSDKAVNPTNVMGATKRWAELIVRQKAQEVQKTERSQFFCAVRFGNVVGSTGSVVPLFKEQIAKGGPLTVTEPDMTRYFMSISEAAELIVQASALSLGGDMFLLDMGEPVRIGDLARNMIHLAGFKVREGNDREGTIPIEVIGIRSGEKMYEELFYDREDANSTRHPKIMTSMANMISTYDIIVAFERLQAAVTADDDVMARQILFEVIAE